MKIELTPDAAQWVETAVASGRFETAEDAVRYAINRAKCADLREMLDATEAEGGRHSTEEARAHVRDHLERIDQTPKLAKVFVQVLQQYHGDSKLAALFLLREHAMLGGRAPLDVAKESTAGADLVLKLLAQAGTGVSV